MAPWLLPAYPSWGSRAPHSWQLVCATPAQAAGQPATRILVNGIRLFPSLCAPFTKDEGIKSGSGLQVGLKNQQTIAVQVANQVTSMAGMNTACYLNLSPTDGRCLINMDRHYYCTSPT